MGTSVQRAMTDEEVVRMPEARQAMAEVGKAGASTGFNYFAAFDGTNNDKDNLKLSGDPFPDQCRESVRIAGQERSE